MGGGYTKLLPYLDVGPEDKESRLRKYYTKILTAGTLPSNCELAWKSVQLSPADVEKTSQNLIEAAHFIQTARTSKENILVCTQPDDPDTVVLATAYIMILSGLPAKESDQAISTACKEEQLKFGKKYQKSLEYLREIAHPKQLRDEMFKAAGEFSTNALSEDVSKIYELAGLPKPSTELIMLDVVYVPSEGVKRGSVPSGPSSRKSSRADQTKVESKTPDSPSRSNEARPLLDRKVSQDSVASDHSPPESGVVEARGHHIEENLLETTLKLTENDHKPEVCFIGSSGETEKDSTDSVTELNSLIMPQTAESTQVANGPLKSTPEEPTVQISDVNVTMKSFLATAKAADSTSSSQPTISDSSLDTLAKIQDSMKKVEIKADPTTINAEINGTSDKKPQPPPSQQRRPIKIVRMKAANHEARIQSVTELLVKRAEERQQNPQPRRHIRIIRVPKKVSAR